MLLVKREDLIDVMGSSMLTSVINSLNMAVDCSKIVRLSWLSSDAVKIVEMRDLSQISQ